MPQRVGLVPTQSARAFCGVPLRSAKADRNGCVWRLLEQLMGSTFDLQVVVITREPTEKDLGWDVDWCHHCAVRFLLE
jgi:hypothetical protein